MSDAERIALVRGHLRAAGMEFKVMDCQVCGQNNRVDVALVLGGARRPKCGKCHGFLRGPQWDSTEGGPPK